MARAAPIPTGTVTLLFTDIEGSTRRWEERRDAMAPALRRHDELLRAAIERHGGHVFKTVGDACCAAFWRATDAVAAAIDAQRELSDEDWSAIGGLQVRMALHSGATDERDGDYFGPVVNRVARLLATAHGGQVLFSGATALLLRGLMPERVGVVRFGRAQACGSRPTGARLATRRSGPSPNVSTAAVAPIDAEQPAASAYVAHWA